MNRDSMHFILLNIGHFLDHFFMLVFATVAALVLTREWGLSYADLLRYATPGFFAFGLFALPAGWLADKWSRDGMMCVFFVGIGISSVATGLAQTPLQIGIGLFIIGGFAAIYHPVGLAILTAKWENTGVRIAVNGVWGNFGVACAALITGYLIDNTGWRMAFIIPGFISIAVGAAYLILHRSEFLAEGAPDGNAQPAKTGVPLTPDYKALLIRISVIVFVTMIASGFIFQSTTYALPKIFDERLQGIASDMAAWHETLGLPGHVNVATMIGTFAFVIFAVASMAQLVVGNMLDRYGPRPVFMTLAVMQLICFSLMPGLYDGLALAVALGFMLGAFGQIPINDYIIGKMASGESRARVYGMRYVVSFTVLAATLPLIALVHENWGFDTLFYILAGSAFVVLGAVSVLPGVLPTPPAAGSRPPEQGEFPYQVP